MRRRLCLITHHLSLITLLSPVPASASARAAPAPVAARAARAVFPVAVAARAATVAALGPRLVDRVGLRAARHGRLRVENLAAVNPDLHSDGPEGRARLGEAVVNVCAQSVQREATLQVPLASRYLGSVQSSGDFDLDALPAEPESLLDGLAHCASEGDALLQLRGDLLGLQLRVQLRLVNLLYGDQDFLAGARGDVGLELVDLCAFAPDDDAGARGVDDELQPVGRALNVNVRDARAREAPLHVLLQLQVFQKEVAELLLREPVRMPVLVVAEAEAVGMNFLTHNFLLSLFLRRLFRRSRFCLLLRSVLRRLLLAVGLFRSRGLLRAA